jgi:hypothetical protein
VSAELTEGTPDTRLFEPQTWVFCGARLDSSGKKTHAWLPLPATDLSNVVLWKPNGSPTVGSEYEVLIAVSDGVTWKCGEPRYLKRHEDEELRALIEAAYKAAETRIRIQRMQNSDRRASSLEAALEPLVSIARELGPSDRTAFIAHVINRLQKVW